MVITNGGPGVSVKRGLDLDVQVFTSGGFAVLEFNNGGSAGGFTNIAALAFIGVEFGF